MGRTEESHDLEFSSRPFVIINYTLISHNHFNFGRRNVRTKKRPNIFQAEQKYRPKMFDSVFRRYTYYNFKHVKSRLCNAIGQKKVVFRDITSKNSRKD